jgi:hypothetical protein
VALALSACLTGQLAVGQTPPRAVQGAPAGEANLEAYIAGLRAASCPRGVSKTAPEPIELVASPVPLQRINPKRNSLGALTYLGGFRLTSPDKRFGGLSDLKVLPGGGLLAASDQGDFVWLDLDADSVTPRAAHIASMLDAAGKPLDGKHEADAEGIAYRDGVAFVSFERDHRVLAYDVGACGGAARGAPVVFGEYGAPLPEAFAAAQLDVPANSGAEALGVSPDGFLAIGLEQQEKGQSPLSLRPIEAAPVFDLRIGKGAPGLVSIDMLPDGEDLRDLRVFTLHRDLDALLGNVIVISQTQLQRYREQSNLPARAISEIDGRSHDRFKVASSRRLAEMSVMLTVDNYEGIAIRRMPDGKVRLYVISDDNFSASQRTLLMVFELPQ